MAKHKTYNLFTGFLCSAILLYLIFDSRRALAAGQAGVALCLRTVVPTLFPFFVLTRLLAASSAAGELARLLAPAAEGLFHLPGAAAPALVLGALGGYPTGAQAAAELRKNGQISREEAERLLAFCSNAGPGFIFGMLGGIFGLWGGAAIFAAHLTSAVLVGILLRGERPEAHRPAAPVQAAMTLPRAVGGAISAMASVCAYVVLFSVLNAALSALGAGFLPDWFLLFLRGALELTSGCAALSEIPRNVFTLCIAGFFLSFGGLCVWCQTKTVVAPAGLTGKYYLKGKTLQGVLTALMLFPAGRFFPDLWAVQAASVPGNHHGLPGATAWVAGAFALFFLLWAAFSRKRAGKTEQNPV